MLTGSMGETLPCNLGSALTVYLFHARCELGGSVMLAGFTRPV